MRPPKDSPSLVDYGRILWRWWPIVVCATILSSGAAWAAESLKPATYEASTRVFAVVAGDAGVPAAFEGGRGAVARVKTYERLVQSNLVAARTVNDLGSAENPSQLASQVTVTAMPGSALLTVTVTDHNDSSAVKKVNALTKNVIEASTELEWNDSGAAANLVLIDQATAATLLEERPVTVLAAGGTVGFVASGLLVLGFETARNFFTTRRQLVDFLSQNPADPVTNR